MRQFPCQNNHIQKRFAHQQHWHPALPPSLVVRAHTKQCPSWVSWSRLEFGTTCIPDYMEILVLGCSAKFDINSCKICSCFFRFVLLHLFVQGKMLVSNHIAKRNNKHRYEDRSNIEELPKKMLHPVPVISNPDLTRGSKGGLFCESSNYGICVMVRLPILDIRWNSSVYQPPCKNLQIYIIYNHWLLQ